MSSTRHNVWRIDSFRRNECVPSTSCLEMTTRYVLATLALAGCTAADPTPASPRTTNDPVAAEYARDVEPILQKKCFACHAASVLPWYHALPGIRGMLDRDIAGAKGSLDLSQGFPFPGRGTQADYLDALAGVLDDGSMPPRRYLLVHWGGRLGVEEKRTIRAWIEHARARRD